MRFPLSLRTNGREALSSDKILRFHYAFARHKPSSDWNAQEELPDFSKIKLDQSFNWSIYSIPLWTRFDDSMNYKSDYAVVGYKVSTIRLTNRINPSFQNFIFDIKTDPLENNYSHIVLVTDPDLKINKTQKRELRMTLKHRCKVSLLPNEKQNFFRTFFDRCCMILSRAIVLYIMPRLGKKLNALANCYCYKEI